MSFGRSRSWNIKLILCSFFLPKMVATSTNLFIDGCSLHGSHQIIIFEAKNSDKSRDGFVTSLSCFERKIVVFHWMTIIKVSWEEAGAGSYLLVIRMIVKNIEG